MVKAFKFQFEALLTYRRHRRDMRRQFMAKLFEDDRRLAEQRERLERQRADQLDQLRTLAGSAELKVDRLAARRYYAGQLQGDMALVDRRRQVVQQQLEMCRRALIEADRDVKALEKLHDKALAEFQYQAEHRAARELEESWSATHLAGGV